MYKMKYISSNVKHCGIICCGHHRTFKNSPKQSYKKTINMEIVHFEHFYLLNLNIHLIWNNLLQSR